MSMHEIESLVECSVMTVANASPVPSQARSICFSLYALQNQFDCGYTVLRVKDKLEKLGYLYLLPPEQLPEPERSSASIDSSSGRCCVTTGSVLWKKLLDQGILPESANTELKELYLMELAEIIIPLAAKALAEGNDTAADTLGLWYALFPLLCMASGYDDDDHPEQERIQALLELMAVPEAFKAAEAFCRDMDFDDFDEDEMSFLSDWGTPYKEWKKKTDTSYPDFCKRMINESIVKADFAEANKYASYLKNGSEFDRVFYPCAVALKYYKWVRESGIKVPLLNDILSLDEAKEGLEQLINLPISPDELLACRMCLFSILFLQGEYAAAVKWMNCTHIDALTNINQIPEESEKQMAYALLVVNYYKLLDHSIPDSFSGKVELIKQEALKDMDIRKTRKVLSDAVSAIPESTKEWQQGISFCDQVIEKYDL